MNLRFAFGAHSLTVPFVWIRALVLGVGLSATATLAAPLSLTGRMVPSGDLQGVCEGRIVDAADPQRPVRGASVILKRIDIDVPNADVMSDDSGRFEFPQIESGYYTLEVEKAGYLRSVLGARSPLGAGRPFQVTDGTARCPPSVNMWRGGAVEGRVLGDNNRPMAWVDVEVRERTTSAGGQTRVTRTKSDDRGHFRVFGLAPGEYYVLVMPRAVATDGEGGMWAPTFFPSGLDSPSAASIRVEAGAEVAGIEVLVRKSRTAALNVRLFGPSSVVLDDLDVTVRVVPDGAGREVLSKSVRATDVSNEYQVVDLFPGHYFVEAVAGTRSSGTPQLWGFAEVHLGESGMSVALSLEELPTVMGDVNAPSLTMSRSSIRLALVPYDTRQAGAAQIASELQGNGSFDFGRVKPGVYESIVLNPPAYDLVLSRGGGPDGRTVLVARGPSVVRLDGTLVARGNVAGRVLADDGYSFDALTIVFVPASSVERPGDVRSPRRTSIRVARIAADGAFFLRGLPSGPYRMVVARDIWDHDCCSSDVVDDLLTGPWVPVLVEPLTVSRPVVAIVPR